MSGGDKVRVVVLLLVGGYCWVAYPRLMGTVLLIFLVVQFVALAWMAAWRSVHSGAKRRRQ